MEKKEYIERGAAKRTIYEYICGHTMSKFLSRELLDASKKGAEGAMYELDYVPSADVVEVVRCKDCVWWEACGHLGTIGKCENPHNGLWNEYTFAGDFCSYGERKQK